MSQLDPDGFNAYERTGWEVVPIPYIEGFGHLTTQAIDPLLDALGVGVGTRLLDLACGPGWLAQAAATRGATPLGVDISTGMVAEASRLHPGLEFRRADAEKLPFKGAEFDAVAINFGILHMGRPEAVLSEARRVLRPGGRLGFTVWAPPTEAVGFGLVLESVTAHGKTDVGLPAGPPFFRFSDAGEAVRTLLGAGYVAPTFTRVPQVWRLPSVERFFEVMREGTVRTRALLAGQTPEALAAIRAAVVEAARPYAKDGGIELPMPAVLATAIKP